MQTNVKRHYTYQMASLVINDSRYWSQTEFFRTETNFALHCTARRVNRRPYTVVDNYLRASQHKLAPYIFSVVEEPEIYRLNDKNTDDNITETEVERFVIC